MVTNDNKKLVKFLAGSIGFNPKINTYYDDDENNTIDILQLDDPIDKEVRFYSSIGLSDYPNSIKMKDGTKKNIPIEILMCGNRQFEHIPNILATCSFYIISRSLPTRFEFRIKKLCDLNKAPRDWVFSKLIHQLFKIPSGGC